MLRLSGPTFCEQAMEQPRSFVALRTHITRYSLGHRLLCTVCLYELPQKAMAAVALGLHQSSLMVMLYEIMLWLCHGYYMVIL